MLQVEFLSSELDVVYDRHATNEVQQLFVGCPLSGVDHTAHGFFDVLDAHAENPLQLRIEVSVCGLSWVCQLQTAQLRELRKFGGIALF